MKTNNKYLLSVLVIVGILLISTKAEASYHFSNYKGIPPIHVYGGSSKKPEGIYPEQIKSFYNLPENGGKGTVAIIGAYDDATIESDLNIFDTAFSLPACTVKNGCLEKNKMSSTIKTNSGWSMETSLDILWSHAIAPKAKILLVEATTPSGKNLLDAVDYVSGRKDVVSVSMSWGGEEFPEETTLDNHFVSKYGAVFFASSGDNGFGASWPASSPNVIAVGGTSLLLNSNNKITSQTAWSGSGGGVSIYEKEPSYQLDYSIPKAEGMRAIPDVSYAADPQFGFSIVRNGKWYVVGGTSAGAPQWAAITALGFGVSNVNFYKDKQSNNFSSYFTDIVSGSNGTCKYYCVARKHYDYITGLGTPHTTIF